jgi:hypothetical protein
MHFKSDQAATGLGLGLGLDLDLGLDLGLDRQLDQEGKFMAAWSISKRAETMPTWKTIVAVIL